MKCNRCGTFTFGTTSPDGEKWGICTNCYGAALSFHYMLEMSEKRMRDLDKQVTTPEDTSGEDPYRNGDST